MWFDIVLWVKVIYIINYTFLYNYICWSIFIGLMMFQTENDIYSSILFWNLIAVISPATGSQYCNQIIEKKKNILINNKRI
jgi:hypothetical protein